MISQPTFDLGKQVQFVCVSKIITLSYYPMRQNSSGLTYSNLCRNVQKGKPVSGKIHQA